MRTVPALFLAAALLPLGCLGEDLEQRPLITSRSAPKHLWFHDVALFDGVDGAVREHQDVEVEDGLIRSVRPTGEPAPSGARVVDGRGKTLLPGLVDTHVHITAPGAAPWRLVKPSPEHNAAANLYAGVTTAYDLSGQSSVSKELRERIEAGEVFGPRLFLTDSSISQKGGHPLPAVNELVPFPLSLIVPAMIVQVEGPDDAEDAVQAIHDKGVDYLKIILDDLPPGTPVLDEPTLKALVDEGHERGMFVLVHIGTAQQALMATRAGADCLAHMVYRDELSEEAARTIAAAHIPVIATIGGFYATADIARGSFRPTLLDKDIQPSSWLDPVTGEQAAAKVRTSKVLSALMNGVLAGERYLAPNVKRLHDAGVTILVGSDSPLPGTYPGSGLHAELEALVTRAGLSPSEALLGATGRAARLFDKDPRYGTVEPGKVADLLLVDGNPLEDIKNTTRIVAVYQGGREVQRNLPKPQVR